MIDDNSPNAEPIKLSVVIPIYNEAEGLDALFTRLYPALDALALRYEIIFINDGSRDHSEAILSQQFSLRPDVTKVILLNGNYGQHMAILSGFERARGDIIVTLDADLQNPPEEIGKLVSKMDEGYDYVGTIRHQRRDNFFRRYASRAMNYLRERITRIKMTDQGCMLRAYSRHIVETINRSSEANTFIPALAFTYAQNPIEIEVTHEERFAGESKYSLYSLVRLNFDLVTGFSVVPLQWLSFSGIALSGLSAGLFIVLLLRRFLLGSEVQGVFTLFAITFFLLGVIVFSLGLLGEYIGRIYQQVRARPRYLIQSLLEDNKAVDNKVKKTDQNTSSIFTKAVTKKTAIVFAYHNAGIRCLKILLMHGIEVKLVITDADDPNEYIWFESVSEFAKQENLPLLMPSSLHQKELMDKLKTIGPHFIFSFNYRHIISEEILNLASEGAYNMHNSLLPKYRGRAPINWAIIHGEKETGATLHQMVKEVDAGFIVAQTAVPILPDENAFHVFEKVNVAAEQTLHRALPDLMSGNIKPLPNNLLQGSYFGKRKPQDGLINWSLSPLQIHNLVRALAPPYPGAFVEMHGQKLIIAKTHLPKTETEKKSATANSSSGLHITDTHLIGKCTNGEVIIIDEVEMATGEKLIGNQLITQLNI